MIEERIMYIDGAGYAHRERGLAEKAEHRREFEEALTAVTNDIRDNSDVGMYRDSLHRTLIGQLFKAGFLRPSILALPQVQTPLDI